ncbi:hypothetical protein [Algoriphagus confluentis]|uniref:TonB C-terminal domain-containing protein n=1 Tax=Algoriphagus confluentis TaxID=1697556 RepID=A0ABQ6PQN2_9BACT|nr:hypothetical protein Aconfl_21410 [Algoriphagus confluentis]
MKSPFPSIFFSVFLVLFVLPYENQAAIAQQNPEYLAVSPISVKYNHLEISRLEVNSSNEPPSSKENVSYTDLTAVEERMAKNLNSHWAWPEYTLDMIDSYSPFLFRTKKSQSLEEVRVVLQVDARGRISGFEVLSEVDKGLKERLDYMIRKMPDCKPVPGYQEYGPAAFELIINK